MDDLIISLVCLALVMVFFGSSLFFWPVYWWRLRTRTQRRLPLVVAGATQILLYTGWIVLVIHAERTIPDFHHAYVFVYAVSLLMNVACWIALLVVWRSCKKQSCAHGPETG